MLPSVDISLLVVLIVFLDLGISSNLDSLAQKSNIYYQQRSKDGNFLEYPLSMVEDLTIKTDIKVIIHGYVGNRFHSSVRQLKNAYMAQGKENVFIADWNEAAHLDYPTSRLAIEKVAFYLAKVLEDFLKKHEIPYSEVHIIGHSLGAHIAGNMGRYFNNSLDRVTGLDPALPLFTPKSRDGLQSNSATFVDVIHTDYPVFGDITPRGTVDFYPNFGHTPQKGCDDDYLISAKKLIFDAYSCSHNRAVTLYAESIGLPKNFPSIPCSINAIKMASSSNCLPIINSLGSTKAELTELKNDNIIYMGENVSRGASGIFYLETYDAPPYGIGLNSRLVYV